MTDHAKRRQAVHSVGDTQDIADAIDRCNLKPEYKRLLKMQQLLIHKSGFEP